MNHCDDDIFPARLEALTLAAGQRVLLHGITADLARGPVTALLGPNGAGKTLLMRLCRGLITPSSGTIRWGEHRPQALGTGIGYVPQDPVMLRRSVRANVAYAVALAGLAPRHRRDEIDAILDTVRLDRLAAAGARRLSGGERQRLAIARAWAQRPRALLLDEPTAHLDPAATAAVEQAIRRVRDSGTRIVLCTHDLGQARRLADEVAFINEGQLVEQAPAARFFEQPASAAAAGYLQGELLTAVPA